MIPDSVGERVVVQYVGKGDSHVTVMGIVESQFPDYVTLDVVFPQRFDKVDLDYDGKVWNVASSRQLGKVGKVYRCQETDVEDLWSDSQQ